MRAPGQGPPQCRRRRLTAANKEVLFLAAHDIKGEAPTFGFPLIALVGDSLRRLIEHTPDVTRIPIALVDQHVDAVRAIHREYSRSNAKDLAITLTKRLRAVADEFLRHENRGRQNVLEQIMGPPIAPSKRSASEHTPLIPAQADSSIASL